VVIIPFTNVAALLLLLKVGDERFPIAVPPLGTRPKDWSGGKGPQATKSMTLVPLEFERMMLSPFFPIEKFVCNSAPVLFLPEQNMVLYDPALIDTDGNLHLLSVSGSSER
jgi:hypothetical protein